MDGATIALRMVQAAEAAAAAATAVATRPDSGKDDWYKMLPKPGVFDPKDREAELSSFRNWWWSVEQYLMAVDAEFLSHFDVLRQNLDAPIVVSSLTADQKRRGTFLYGLLASLLRNRPLLMLKGVDRGNGFEAVRQLFKTCQPSSRNRALGLLHILMRSPEFEMKSAMLPQILKLEDSFREYERIGGVLSGELKFAILMKSIGGQLKTYLNMTIQDSTTYDALRESILQYDQATIKWSSTMALGSNSVVANDGPAPMEVDRIWKGKGQGKYKGKHDKGKGDEKGWKGKGKSDNKGGKGFKGSWNNGGWNQGKGSWNQNSQNQNADGKSGKSSPKGKGKSGKSKGACFKCGKFGHMAKECRVRFVEEADDSCGDHAASSSTTNATGAANTSNSSGGGKVSRVSLHEHSTSSSSCPQYFFDLSVCSDFSRLSVNAVSEVVEVFKCDDGRDHFDLLDPETSSDASGGSIDCGDLQHCLQTVGDECFQDSLHCSDECMHSSTNNIEFISCPSSTCCCEYSLCTLCKLDDCDHFNHTVSLSNGFNMYERVLSPRGAWNMIRRFDDSSCFKLNCCKSDAFESFALDVRAVRSCCDIILDSGSDATVIPIGMVSAGVPSANQSSYLRDAQGAKIDTEGVRDVSIVLTAVDGSEIVLQDKAHVSSRVDMPLISYGKLLRHGWGIVPEDGRSFLVHSSGAKVELSFKQNSLLISGVVRMIAETVRVIDVDVPKAWRDLKNGWYKTKDGFPLCSSHARHFVDVLKNHTIDEWPYRTTVAYRDGQGWQVIELCQSVFQLDEREAPLEGFNKLITLLSKNIISLVDFGMVMNSSVTPDLPGSSASAPPQRDVEMTGASTSGAVHGRGGGQQREVGGARQQATTNRNENPEIARAAVPVSEPSSGPREVPVIPTSIAVDASSDRMTIAGVDVTKDSSIVVLKAACEYMAVSQSGSKSKLWKRLVSTVDKQKILEETQLATTSLGEGLRNPVAVQLATPPSDEQVQLHMLTHTPYAAWCEACVSMKGKPDRREANPTRVRDREIPVLSFDFSSTGKSMDDQSGEDGLKLTALVAHDSHSGSLACFPLKGKDDAKHAVHEMVKYLQYLGHGDVCLRCDQEPAILVVQSLLQRTWQRKGFRVVIENSKVLDHGGNALAEKSIDRIRSMAGVLLRQLSTNIGHEIPANHPLFSWAFKHAGWLIDRFVTKANMTAYEVIRGHAYRGKLCQYGEPVMCYVADTTKRKGDARWKQGIFLGKALTNDMFVVHCDGNIRLTRSVKAIYKDWSEHMGLYRTIVVQPWHIEGTIGNRIDPVGSRSTGEALPLDDEPGDDSPAEEVSTEAFVGVPVSLTPIPEAEKRMKAPPSTAVVASPVTPFVPPTVHVEVPFASSGGAEDVAMPSPALTGPPAATTPLGDDSGDEGRAEPTAKRQKLSTRRVGGEELCHMDVESYEYIDEQIEQQVFDQFAGDDDDIAGYDDDNLAWENGTSTQAVSVWMPISEFQPELPADEMSVIDAEADKIEVQRLLSMSVITTVDGYSGKLDIPLSAKMVRTWRKKTKTETDQHGVTTSQLMWMRRSRLVGRDFNFLEYREDVYSPASSSSVVKLLPSLALSDGFVNEGVIATLDVSDAFLQVPQPIPRKISLDGCEYVILKCLPGQRDASRLWYSYFVERLRAHVSVDVCPEQPCILRCAANDNLCGVLLLHVDDVLIHGTESWISDILIPSLEKEFKLTYTMVPRHQGGTLEFLKRVHVVEPNYTSITISAENKHASSLIERFSKIDGKIPRVAYTPCSDSISLSKTDLLSPGRAAEYRSLVGIAMYLAQERFDLQYATKTLAGFLQQPTKSAWNALGRLVGYLRFSEDFGLKMEQSKRGCTFMEALLYQHCEREKNTIEVFSDSDWSGSGDMKSTSSAVHVLNGIIVYSTSRSQKCISLSSTEAEWYSASSGVCDAYYLQHILEFITCGNCNILTLHTDNSAVRMLSLKFGVGRLRHIRGRMLWLQERMASHELNIRQVPTLHNIGDLNTKSHSKNRFLALLYMFGFTTSKDQRVGAEEFSKQQAKELMKKQVNLVGHVLKNGSEFSSASVTGLNQTAKRVLRILSTCSLMDLATGAMYPSDVVVDSADTMSPSPEALSPWLGMWMAMLFTAACVACGIFWLFRYNRQRVDDDEVYAPEEQSDGATSVASAATDYGFPLSDLQERIFLVLDRGNHPEEAICEWMTSRCSRRLAIAESSDRGTVMFYHDCLVALANARRNLLTCDEQERRNIFGYLRSLSRMSPRECSPIREMAALVESGRVANETIGNLHGVEDIPMDDDNSDSEISDTLLEQQRRDRYRFVPLEEASDPDLWQEVRHGGPNSDSGSSIADVPAEPADEPMPEIELHLREIHQRRFRALRRIRNQLQEAYNTGTQEEIWELEAEQAWWASVI